MSQRSSSFSPDAESTESSESGESRPLEAPSALCNQGLGVLAHEAGELHRLLVESVHDYAIFALDRAGYILSWNAGAERFKGYSAEDIVGQHFSIFYPPEKVAEGFPASELREAAQHGRFEDEGWRVRKDGSRFWANVIITALRDDVGELVGFAKVTRDLTAQRQAEEALRLSAERFRVLVQTVKDYAIFMLDPGGHVATWNEGAQRIKGYKEAEILGEHFSIFYPRERVAEGFPDYELEVASREGRFEDEGWRIRKDGSRFWANVVITALRDREGALIGFGKVTRDLTERRAAERRAMEDAKRVAAEEAARHEAEVARRRTERLQAITSALLAAHTTAEIARVVLSDGFTAVEADAGALAVAESGGESVQILVQTGYGELAEPPSRFSPSDEHPIVEAIRTGETIVCRSREECGSRFPSMAPMLDEFEATVVVPLRSRGRAIGSIAIHRRSSRGLSTGLIAFMETFAQQCSQALERAQLYQAEQLARARADEANRAKSEFLAAMSHELRTPLNAIGGYTDLLMMGLRGPITEEQQADLERIRRGQQHLLAIINDILNFSRIDSGQMEYELGKVSLQSVLDTVAHLIDPQATFKGIEFVVAECPPDTIVWADRVKTEQILLNLLSNAVKFTARGGRVTLRCDLEDAATAHLAVSDTGSGIAPDQLERIFEPFVQVGRSLTSTREGTGLGLAISRDLARAMGGDIRVESALGIGSTFTLTLPRPSAAPGGAH